MGPDPVEVLRREFPESKDLLECVKLVEQEVRNSEPQDLPDSASLRRLGSPALHRAWAARAGRGMFGNGNAGMRPRWRN